MEQPDITIIGPGNVGKALLKVLTNVGYNVKSVFSRREIEPDLRNSYHKTTFIQDLSSDERLYGKVIFITVPDDSIEQVTQNLAGSLKLKERFVIHCSGTLSSEILSPAKKAGAVVASFHPIKAITPKTENLADIWFDVEGDEEAMVLLKKMAEEIGADSFRVSAKAKPYLHASAVVASNYLVVLAELVRKISTDGEMGEDQALKALLPLMQHTLQNVSELGPAGALTGPIARGDVKTVKHHLEILNNNPEVRSLYSELGKIAVELAEEKTGSTNPFREIKKLFESNELG